MRYRTKPFFAAFSVLLFLSGCGITHQMIAVTESVDDNFNNIPPLHIKGSVALTNTSSDITEKVICTYGPHKTTGKLQQFTDVSVEVVKKILNKNEMLIDEWAPKKLELSVTRVSCSTHLFGWDLELCLSVKAGNGYKNDYIATNSFHTALWQATSSVEHAMASSIEQMLNDRKLIQYLEDDPSKPLVKMNSELQTVSEPKK